jgi:hypothetical protein
VIGLKVLRVEVADVFGGEDSDGAAVVVPERRRFGTQGGFEVGKEVMRVREVVKKRVGLRDLTRRSGGRCSRR